MPFTSWPDRADVPRNAARPLRYMDRFVTVSQGEVFYMTQALAELEGLERGPAGNISLAAAMAIAQDLDENQILVVQETEYTGAGKHPLAQLNLARQMGVEVKRGDPRDDKPGQRIVIPEHPSQIAVKNVDLQHVRRSYICNAMNSLAKGATLSTVDLDYLVEETQTSQQYVQEVIDEWKRKSR